MSSHGKIQCLSAHSTNGLQHHTQRDRSRDETFKGEVPLHPRYNAVMGVAAAL